MRLLYRPRAKSVQVEPHVPLRLAEPVLRPRFARTGGLGTSPTMGEENNARTYTFLPRRGGGGPKGRRGESLNLIRSRGAAGKNGFTTKTTTGARIFVAREARNIF